MTFKGLSNTISYTMPKGQKLSPRQLLFIRLYASPSSETYGNATKSYVAAGYKDGPNKTSCVSKLLNTASISKALSSYVPEKTDYQLKKVEITKDYALSKLQETYEIAREKGDITNQVACVRLMMQHNNLLNDRIVVDIADSRRLDEHKHRQAKQIASIILNGGLLQQPSSPPITGQFPAIPASFDNSPQSQQQQLSDDIIDDLDDNDDNLFADNDLSDLTNAT